MGNSKAAHNLYDAPLHEMLGKLPIDDYNAPIEDYDENDLAKQKTERYTQDTSHRHSLIGWMMVVVSIWLILVICIVALNVKCQLFISDTVLNTLLATTTVNILGLPFIILKDLFNGR